VENVPETSFGAEGSAAEPSDVREVAVGNRRAIERP
jgi:hypothetical protein